MTPDEMTVVGLIHAQLQDLDTKVDDVIEKADAAATAAHAAKAVATSTLEQTKITNGRVSALEMWKSRVMGIGAGVILVGLAVDLASRLGVG